MYLGACLGTYRHTSPTNYVVVFYETTSVLSDVDLYAWLHCVRCVLLNGVEVYLPFQRNNKHLHLKNDGAPFHFVSR